MAKEKECPCCSMKAHGTMKIVLGLLVLANAYWPTVSWPVFIGAVMVLAGIIKVMHK